MGSTEDPDPKDQAAIAGSIFTAVFVYTVWIGETIATIG
jgi:hypothetical protein